MVRILSSLQPTPPLTSSELVDEGVNFIITGPPHRSPKDNGTEDQVGPGSGVVWPQYLIQTLSLMPPTSVVMYCFAGEVYWARNRSDEPSSVLCWNCDMVGVTIAEGIIDANIRLVR